MLPAIPIGIPFLLSAKDSSLSHILSHDLEGVSPDILNNGVRDVVTDICQRLDKKLHVGILNIRIQEPDFPLALDPGPDSLDGVEEGGCHRKEHDLGPTLLKFSPELIVGVSTQIVQHEYLAFQINYLMEGKKEYVDVF